MSTKANSKPHRSLRAIDGRNVLARTRALAMNLWWTWNPDAQRLFASLDPKLRDATHHNPIATLELLAPERREAVETDPLFADHVARVESGLKKYLSASTWCARTARGRSKPMLVAYFCAEFAVHESLPQYSGGLGVLAGDHLKSASDLGVPLVGVGLLYRCGFYTQQLNPDGSTRVIYPTLDFARLPIHDTGRTIDVSMGHRSVRAKIWRQVVGRTNVFSADTDVPQNSRADRALTRHLYGGDRAYRIQQEILLGIGGVLALKAMGLLPTVFHLNEGHAAFATLQRLRMLIKLGHGLDSARQIVRSSSIFTTHTPVPAGNDRFSPALTMKYLKPFMRDLGLSRDELLALGREDPSNKSEEFCMTVLALRLCAHCNGVAKLHGETSRKMWTKVFNTDSPSKVPIGHVTNGIHSQTWLAPEMHALYDKYLKPKWVGGAPTSDCWKRATKIPADCFWPARRVLRDRLVRFVRQRLVEQVLRRHGSLDELIFAQTALNPDALTIGFARRFATYKRGNLIFRDPKRLAHILGDPKRPVQFIFAGKAHPADLGGQKVAQAIYRLAREPRFLGRVVILEDYDMEVGRMLTSGCDVWLNNPLRPQEASGTSGMKPPLHGGINCSILDGWWPEGFNRKNGWAINGRQFDNQRRQDRHDAETIYKLLETQIAPEFYDRDRSGIPRRWVKRMIESMRSVCPQFNTDRMVGEYVEKYYRPAHAASSKR